MIFLEKWSLVQKTIGPKLHFTWQSNFFIQSLLYKVCMLTFHIVQPHVAAAPKVFFSVTKDRVLPSIGYLQTARIRCRQTTSQFQRGVVLL